MAGLDKCLIYMNAGHRFRTFGDRPGREPVHCAAPGADSPPPTRTETNDRSALRADALQRPADAAAPPPRGKLFIKTFGCQMNEYDSAKMADVLRAADGYELTDDVDEADVILFNTCSVREKAQEKVFSDLGRVEAPEGRQAGVLIGVGGCVASQEGAAIVERAPYVDLVFGPQTLHRLPELIARAARSRPAAGRHQLPRDREVRPPAAAARRRRRRAFVSIMEGCSKYCTFCVVPYTRGEEVSRPFDDVLAEVAGLADQGVKEITLLGQNVNAYRGADGRTARSPTSRC